MTTGSLRVGLTISIVVLVAAAARFAPLFHDFWLDEVWSYLLVRDLVAAPTDILTKLHTDNNHPLNSLTLYLLGASVAWPVYRLPAWFSGVLSVALSYLLMRRFGTAHAIYATSLVACSYPLIVYSTEARGYAMMLLCVLLAVDSLERWLATGNWLRCAIFWAAVIVGFLSHLTFIHAYLAMLVFSAHELRRAVKSLPAGLTGFAVCHAVPLVFLAALYWCFIRHVAVGGAAPTRLLDALVESINMALGGPSDGWIGMLYVGCFLALLILGLSRMQKLLQGWHLLFSCGIVFVPLPLILWRLVLHPESTPVFPRYFLTSILFSLLLIGFFLGDLHKRGRRGKIVSIALLMLIISGNVVHTVRFTLVGRGRYLQSLQYMVRESPAAMIHVAGNSDFRTPLLFSFYNPYLPNDRQTVYHSRQRTDRSQRADWWIMESLEPHPQLARELSTPLGNFSLQQHFEFYGPSGCAWAVYRQSQDSE